MENQTLVQAGTQIRTGAHTGLALTLEGGRSLRVDEHSELAVLSTERLRLARGAVYVDSGSDVSRSGIRVETHFGIVEEIGTIFEVRAAGSSLHIRIREGKVRLDSLEHSVPVEAMAGEELIVGRDGGLQRRAIPTSDPQWHWAESLASTSPIEGRPLFQFLQWVARETGRKLTFQNDDIEAISRKVILHGSIRNLAPLEALDLMLSTTNLEYTLPNERSILIQRRPL